MAYDDTSDLRDFAEKVLELHRWCAGHPNVSIAYYRETPYMRTKSLLIQAIQEGWPNLSETDIQDVYDIMVDSGESVEYAVNDLELRKAYEEYEKNRECEGHETLRGDMMGETFYCDGSCKK